MLGYVVWSEEKGKSRGEEMYLAGVRFCRVAIGRGGAWERRRAERAAAIMARAGVRRVVFPEEFPYLPLFARWRIRPVNTAPLRRELVWPWLEERIDRLQTPHRQLSAAVCTASADRQQNRLVEHLVRRCRYVMLDGPGEELARRIRREQGAVLRLDPGREELEKADILVLFTCREDLSGRNPIFCADYPGAQVGRLSLRLPRVFWPGENAPQGEEGLAAALWSAGVLSTDTILKEIPC